MGLMSRMIAYEQWLLLLSILLTKTHCSPRHFQGDQIICSESRNIAQDQSFLSHLRQFQGSYTFTLEMSLLTENVTYLVKEVRNRDATNGMRTNSTFYLGNNGKYQTFYYYPKTNTLLEDSDGTCRRTSAQNFPLKFWGWLNEGQSSEETTFGPAAILKRFFSNSKMQRLQADQNPDANKYAIWETCEANGSISVRVYFPLNEFSKDSSHMMPLHFEVIFMDESERIQYTVLRFLPHVDTSTLSGGHKNSACSEMVKPLVLPTMPDQFSYWQEVVETSHLDGEAFQGLTLQKLEVTHSQNLGLTRLDIKPQHHQYSHYDTSRQLKVIKDILSGTAYAINKEFRNCSRTEISKSATNFLYDTTHQLYLDDSFSFLGLRNKRGIDCELWASTLSGVPDPGLQSFPKVDLQICFAMRQYQSSEGSAVKVDVPIRSDLVVYDPTDPYKVLKKITTNFHNFEPIKDFPAEVFSIKECLLRNDKNRREHLRSSHAKDEGDVDPEHQFTAGDMIGMASAMVLLGIMMSASFLVIIVKIGPKISPIEIPPSDMVRMSYINLKSRANQGESES